MPSALSLLTTTFTEPKDRGRAFGVYGAIAAAGGAVGLLLGGALTEYLSWRWTLYINLFFAGVAFVGGLMLLERHPSRVKPQLDIPGVLLVSSGLFCLVYGFSNAATHSWHAPSTYGFLIAGVALLAVFAFWQTRAGQPAAAAAGSARPQPGRRLPVDADRLGGHVRDLPVPDLLPAADPRLHADRHRLRRLADRRRHRGRG